jgi:hypothetical protein
LSPIVTGGLPTPGPLAAAAVERALARGVAAVELEELVREEELPQAASKTAAANATTAPITPFSLGERIVTPVRV